MGVQRPKHHLVNYQDLKECITVLGGGELLRKFRTDEGKGPGGPCAFPLDEVTEAGFLVNENAPSQLLTKWKLVRGMELIFIKLWFSPEQKVGI